MTKTTIKTKTNQFQAILVHNQTSLNILIPLNIEKKNVLDQKRTLLTSMLIRKFR